MKRIICGLVMGLLLANVIGFASPYLAAAKDSKDKDKSSAATAVFEVYKDKGEKFRFRLKDPEGDLLAISGKGYDKKDECQAVIDAIKKDASRAKVEDDTK
jgi:uncharacterized protein YegP (UPF0339 family)